MPTSIINEVKKAQCQSTDKSTKSKLRSSLGKNKGCDKDCSICKKEVTENCKGVACNKCNGWFHTVCVGISATLYKGLNIKNLFWFCDGCIDSVNNAIQQGKDSRSSENNKNKKKNECQNDAERISGTSGSMEKTEDVTSRRESTGVNKLVQKSTVNLAINSIEVIGDSLVRGLGASIKEKIGQHCITESYPGAGLSRIAMLMEKRLCGTRHDTTVISIGGNDIETIKFPQIQKQYIKLIDQLKKQSKKSIVILGILPRMNANREWLSRALGVNTWLHKECSNQGMHFIDCWDYYIGNPGMYRLDGVHLSNKGRDFLAEEIKRLLEQVYTFL